MDPWWIGTIPPAWAGLEVGYRPRLLWLSSASGLSAGMVMLQGLLAGSILIAVTTFVLYWLALVAGLAARGKLTRS